MKDKNYRKVRDHCHYTGEYRGAAHSICNLKYNVPEEIPIVFHKRSNYDHHFLIKELAQQFKNQFTCLGENTEKYHCVKTVQIRNFFWSVFSCIQTEYGDLWS